MAKVRILLASLEFTKRILKGARMLVLSRKIQETIQVGEVTFTIVRIGSNHVRVGIDAPKDQAILRGELVEKQETFNGGD